MIENLDFEKWIEIDFDLLIDARSPREFAYSKMINSKNFYALNDEEFNYIGIIYKQNKNLAKVKGASYICKNLSKHLNDIYQDCKIGSKIGIYCAKGGNRSKAIATVLSSIGYRVFRLDGGYKAYRNKLCDYFSKTINIKFLTLFGSTGCGKTRLIRKLKYSIDLENMADHFGSVFGGILGSQKSQKSFEDEIFLNLIKFEKIENQPCFIEGESSKIGCLTLPRKLYEAMNNSCKILVQAKIETRIKNIIQDYNFIKPDFFYSCMQKISPFISRNNKNDVLKFFDNGDYEKVCEILILKYYDKVYKKPDKYDFVINSDDIDLALNDLISLRKRYKNA